MWVCDNFPSLRFDSATNIRPRGVALGMQISVNEMVRSV